MALTQGIDARAVGPRSQASASSLGEEFGGSRLLVSDIRTAWLLADAARHAGVKRFFGVSKEQENLLTLVVLLAVADSAGRGLHRLLGAPAVPSFGDSLLGGGIVNDLAESIAGPAGKEMPLTGALLAAAVVAGAIRPAVVKTARTGRSAAHGASSAFHHRYGYLVDPGHWRSRRAQRREARSVKVPQTG